MDGQGRAAEGGAQAVRAGAVDLRAYTAAMRAEVEQLLGTVVRAVNGAPDGQWIAGSEEAVRDAVARFRERAFQQAVQMRLAAYEAAFSPSAGPGHWAEASQQGPA